MDVCMNCHILLRAIFGRHIYLAVDLSPDLVSIVEQWCGREVTQEDHLCEGCFKLIENKAINSSKLPSDVSIRPVESGNACISCGVSLNKRRGRRKYKLVSGSYQRNFIQSQIFPRQTPDDAWACTRCWMRAYNAAGRRQSKAVTSDSVQGSPDHSSTESQKRGASPADDVDDVSQDQPQDTFINLSGYIRAPDVRNKCFVETCYAENLEKAPAFMRTSLLKQCNFFIPQTSLVCAKHKTNWDFMAQPMEEIHFFKPEHVAGMLQLMSIK